MSATEKRPGFFDHWAPIEAFLQTGEGLGEVAGNIGRLSIMASSDHSELNKVRGMLARAKDKIESDGYDGPNADVIKDILAGHIDALGEKDILWLSQEYAQDNEASRHLANEELAFAANELGVDARDLPVWIQMETYGRYFPLPAGFRERVAQERAEFESNNHEI